LEYLIFLAVFSDAGGIGANAQFGGETDSLELSGCAFGDFVQDEKTARQFASCEAAAGGLDQIAISCTEAFTQNDGRPHGLAEHRVRDGKGDGLKDRRVQEQCFFDLVW
jgi:hypothetical protein